MNTVTKHQDPTLRSIQARFDASNPDMEMFAKTLRKSRVYYINPCQQNDNEWLVSRMENGRGAFSIDKATMNTVRPVDDDPTWIGYFFDENTMSIEDAVDAMKQHVKAVMNKKIEEHRQALAQLDIGMMKFNSITLD